jgi:8-amino-7-oxononanoate synthase
MSDIAERLSELEGLGLSRRLRLVSGPQGPTVLLDGSPVLLLCSNNYLGLADHPRVREAAAEAAMRWGAGAGASRLISGTMTVHRRLEERLASFERSEACLLFGSGYLANLGVIGALAGRGDTVFSDELNHASIVDGCRLSRAEVVVYRHLDVEHLEWSMRQHRGDGHGRSLIVTDSVFSMDGHVAPLHAIVEIAHAHGARVAVDEAHATGVLGPDGRGAIAHAGLEGEVDVLIGTLGKALGSYGAYVCAQEEVVRYLINTARSLIFSTAPGPPAVAAALAALELLQERPRRVQRLHANARALRRALAAEGFPVAEDDMPIVPLVLGDERQAMRMCQQAIEDGVFAQAIRPPTVPAGTSRLRLAAMASHTAADMVKAAGVLARAARKLGLDPAQAGAPPHRRESSEPEADEDDAALPATEVYAAPAAPFDLERHADPAPVPAGAAARAPSAPFDGERDGELAPRPSAPFDGERDAEIARAA